MGLLPDEAKCLPPPGLVNRYSVHLGFMGWAAALLQNLFMHRPALRSGVHRQVLMTSVGWFLGYHLSKYETYKYAERDRVIREYMRQHPELFPVENKKTMAEIVEPFHPIH
ncbi:NADH dehydrogenase [ubiquinone] 1 subunit C2 [Neosynchiropus ocellatus]